jgi:hypothetical protein
MSPTIINRDGETKITSLFAGIDFCPDMHSKDPIKIGIMVRLVRDNKSDGEAPKVFEGGNY